MICPRCQRDCGDSTVCNSCGMVLKTKINNDEININFNEHINKRDTTPKKVTPTTAIQNGVNHNNNTNINKKINVKTPTPPKESSETVLLVESNQNQNGNKYQNIWDNSKVDVLIQERNDKKFRNAKAVKIVLVVILVALVLAFGAVTLSDKFMDTTTTTISKMSNIIIQNGVQTVAFEDGTQYSIPNSIKYDNDNSPCKVSTVDGDIVVLIDNQNTLHICTETINKSIENVETMLLSSDGTGLLYLKNAINLSSTKYYSDVTSGDLYYYNFKTDKNMFISSNVLDSCLAISPSGKSFSYVKNYEEKLDSKDSNNDSLSFECYVCTDYGNKSEDEPFKGYSNGANNPVILALSDDAKIRYWYDVANPKVDEYAFYVSLKKSKKDKSDNSTHNVTLDDLKYIKFSQDCSQVLLVNSNGSYIISSNSDETTISNERVTSLINLNSVQRMTISNDFSECYMLTEGNSLLYVDENYDVKNLSSGNFSTMVFSEDCNYYVAKKTNTNSLFRVNTLDGSTETVSDDVDVYTISKDGSTVYYLGQDKNLYAYQDGKSKTIGTQVSSNFVTFDSFAYYIMNGILYRYDGETVTKVSDNSNVTNIYTYTDSVLFQDSSNKCYFIDSNLEISEVELF